MSRFASASSRIVQRPRYTVRFNGIVERQVEVNSISRGFNLQAGTARLTLPQYYSGTGRKFEDAFVSITRQGQTYPDFLGWVEPIHGSESATSSDLSIVARTVVGFLDRVYVGDVVRVGVSRFSKYNEIEEPDPITGLPPLSGWNLENIIRTIMGPQSIDANWRSLVQPGDLSGLRRIRADVDLSDITFANDNLLNALRRLLAFAPDVICRERFSGGTTLLDFVLMNDNRSGARVFIAPSENAPGPEAGASIVAHHISNDNSGIFSRCVAYGSPKKSMVTFSTLFEDFLETPNPMRLEPDWPSATPYGTFPITENESKVLNQVVVADPRSPAFQADLAPIFKRFRIPRKWCKLYQIASKNVALETESGARIGVQIFQQKLVRADDQTGAATGQTLYEISPDEYQILGGARLDWDEGILELAEPAVGAIAVGGTGPSRNSRVMQRLDVFVTLTITNRFGQRIGYDTGARGFIDLPTIKDSGLTLQLINESVEYWEIAPTGITDALGEAHDIAVIYLDEVTGVWVEYAPGAAFVVRDDRPFLAAVAERAIAEKNANRTEATIELPMVLSSIRPGDTVRIRGRGIDNKRLTVLSVDISYASIATRIRASDKAARPRLDTEFERPPNMQQDRPAARYNAEPLPSPMPAGFARMGTGGGAGTGAPITGGANLIGPAGNVVNTVAPPPPNLGPSPQALWTPSSPRYQETGREAGGGNRPLPNPFERQSRPRLPAVEAMASADGLQLAPPPSRNPTVPPADSGSRPLPSHPSDMMDESGKLR
jgi:hypothetical protein